MKIPQFSLKEQMSDLKPALLKAVEELIDSGQFILGDTMDAFESEIASWLGVKHAIGVASGTEALYLSLKALGVGKGDYVLTTPFTFFATISAILEAGALPVFADINPDTYNLDPHSCSKTKERCDKEGKKIKAVIPVHLYGLSADIDAIRKIFPDTGIIEDAAQAFGTTADGIKCGSMGDLAAFSFFPTKNLGACGDAGCVTTNDERLAHKVKMLRVHGSDKRYYHTLVGHNGRMDSLQAAMLRVKLPHASKWIKRRCEIAALYSQGLKEVSEIVIPKETQGHSFHQYTVRVKDGRDELFDYLNKEGVGVAIYYPVPAHLQEAIASLGYKKGDFPLSEEAADQVLSLPIYPEITDEEINLVCKTLKQFFVRV